MFLEIMRKNSDLTTGYREACRETGTKCYHPRHARKGMLCGVCGHSIYSTPKEVK